MENIFDENCKKKIGRQIDDIFYQLEVSNISFRSKYVDDNSITFEELERKLESDKTFKIPVNDAELLNELELKNDIFKTTLYHPDELHDEWAKAQPSLFEQISTLAEKGENKYDLNSFFQSLFKLIDNKIENCNLNSWIKEKEPQIIIGPVLLYINNEYKPLSLVYFDLSLMRVFIETQFLFRKSILNELKYELVKIFSKNLLVPIKDLPSITYPKKNTEIFEILLLMEREANFEGFENFKAITMQILGLNKNTYMKLRASYGNKGNKFPFLRRVLKKWEV